MDELTFGSLFAGIGGIDLGLERAEMTCKWQVEIDDYCQRVLNKHWPDVEKFRNVREVGKHNLKPVDVIAGGFPCQPHSVAGKRKGAADDRNLWPEYLRIVKELRPTWVLGENVPGIRTTYLDTVLSDLESEGYATRTFNIPAVAFDAQHLRYRIFVVAYSSRAGLAKPGTRRKLSQWFFNKMISACRDRAEKEAKAISFIDPAFTSQRCRKCGRIGTRLMHSFTCRCGHEEHADINASHNIRDSFTVLRNSGPQISRPRNHRSF